MLDPAVVLFANDAFYLAFNAREFEAMDNLWARETPAVCVHPGWNPLLDRDEIMESWRAIFSNGDSQPGIRFHGGTVVQQGGNYSVIGYEELSGGWLVVTNCFAVEDGAPRMFHHQASHCAEPPQLGPEAPASVQ